MREDNNIKVETPKNDIYVLDSKYINGRKSVYYLKSEGFFKTNIFIENSRNKKLFKSSYKYLSGCGTLKNPKNDKVLYEYKGIFDSSDSFDLIITSFRNGREINSNKCNIKRKNSFRYYIYEIKFFNEATNKMEQLEVVLSGTFKDCKIYYGEKEKNGVLICKFNISRFFTINFTVEIASNIDALFILILINFLFRIIK